MAVADNVRLRRVGVVVTANFYNPSIHNNDFLVNNSIVPDDWDVLEGEAVSTPAVSVIKYKNGIQWIVDQQRLDIGKDYDMPFHDPVDDEMHRRVASYVKVLPHVPYKDVGLNCVVSIANDDPLQWMTQKFLKPEPHLKNIGMVPQFVMNLDDSVLNFSFGDGTAQHDGKMTKSIIIDCNHHFTGPFDSNDHLQSIVLGWSGTKNIIETKLTEVLK